MEQLRKELVDTLPSSVAASKSQLDTEDLAADPEEQAKLTQLFESDVFKLYREALARKERARSVGA